MSDMTHVVTHPKLHMLVNGQTQKMEVGTEMKLTGAQAKLLGSKVKEIKTAKKVDMTKK